MKRFTGFLVALLGFVMIASVGFAKPKEIVIGGIFDVTGRTGAVGAPYAEAVRDYVKYLNENGGINGMKIKLLDVDYQYKIPQALAAYKNLQGKAIAIQGWGTGDTEALSPLITRDKIPYMSASYSEHLTDPSLTPYNFLIGVTYADQARVALEFIKQQHKGPGKPKVCFIYNDTGFGRSPFFTVKYRGKMFPAADAYAKKIGVDVVDTEIVALNALEATSQLLNMQKSGAEWAIVQETKATATVLKDAKKLGLKTKFIALNWGMNKLFAKIAGDAAEGVYWTCPFGLWTDTNLPGVQLMRKVSMKYHPNKKDRIVCYSQGFAAMYVMAEALKRAKSYTGEGIKNALESLKNLDTGGLTGPITFSSKSHKGSVSLRIYQFQKGKFVAVSDYIKVAR
jgi:branched-chain amino acid transport system substrate-binding protein